MKRVLALLLLSSFSAQADLFSETAESSSDTKVLISEHADDSLDIFQEQLAKEGDSALDALERVSVKRIEKRQLEKRQEKKKLADKWQAPDQCHCYFNLCLTSENMSDSWEESKAKEKAGERYREKRNKICRRWSRDHKKYGPAAAERELQALANDHQRELNNALDAIQARKQQENAERQAYLARLKAEKAKNTARREAEKRRAQQQWQKDAEQACARVYQSTGNYCSVACPLPEKMRNCKVISQ